jgi:hypothetical protein
MRWVLGTLHQRSNWSNHSAVMMVVFQEPQQSSKHRPKHMPSWRNIPDISSASAPRGEDLTTILPAPEREGILMTTASLSNTRPKEVHWLGEPVVHHKGTYDQVATEIPTFSRRPFGLYTRPREGDQPPLMVGENPYYDEVVKLDFAGEHIVPVGIVSKSYKLIQHRELFETAVSALDEADVDLSFVMVSLTISELGGRMALRFLFPERFGFDPGDSHPLRLRLECFNSVDGSSRLVPMMSWYRLICSNGLVARVTGAQEAMIHTESATVPDIKALIADGIASLSAEREFYGTAAVTSVDRHSLQIWVDGEIRSRWGALAAARTFLICETGSDGVFVDPFDKHVPSQKLMRRTKNVPGAPAKSENAYAIAQVLAWIAQGRLDVQEQTKYMREIPQLMHHLAPTAYPKC